jgi:peroxiredoxin/uncharacterized membrane protein YphA (DoxX/SURF4 family)
MVEPALSEWVLFAARLTLAGVFLAAAVAKLADSKGTYQALVGFGVPPLLAPALRTLLPLSELAVGVALLPTSTSRPAAFVALAMLTLFTAAIASALWRGKSPPCRCFGELTSAPIGRHTLVRNTLLMALGGFVAIYGWNNSGYSILSRLTAVRPHDVLIIGAAFSALIFGSGVAFLLFQVLRQQGRILLRLEAIEVALLGKEVPSAGLPAAVAQSSAPGLRVGSAAPLFSAIDLDGAVLDLRDLLALRKPILLIFAHPRCGPCEVLTPEIAAWQQAHSFRLTIIVVSEGSAEENREKLRQHGLTTVLLQKKTEVADQYHAYGTPSAVLIRADGTIGSPLAGGAEAIRRLLAATLEMVGGTPTAIPQPGEMAPAFILQDLDGRKVGLSDLRGSGILLVFFNPSCGFCRKMQGSLKAWEVKIVSSERRLVIIAQGDAREMAALEFNSKVLMDYDGRVTRSFGISGTPMALLLDSEGRVASEVAAGADALFRLAQGGIHVRPDQLSGQQESTAVAAELDL